MVVGALVAHLAYYVLRVGGDHFEYRVLTHLVPLLWLSLPALLRSGGAGDGRVVLGMVLALALSLPIPWTHQALSRTADTMSEAREMSPDVHAILPLGPWTRSLDALQDWLIVHKVGERHATHARFGQLQALRFPDPGCVADRSCVTAGRQGPEGVIVDPGIDVEPLFARWPTLDLGAVGAPAWSYPGVVVLDLYGLNDPLVARLPWTLEERRMAHERVPAEGYAECFRPNAFPALGVLRRADGELIDVLTPPGAWYDTVDLDGPLPLPPRYAGREDQLEVRPGCCSWSASLRWARTR